MQDQKKIRRAKVRARIRKSIRGTSERPRLSVFRSNKAIYAQVIDDTKGMTIVSASTREQGVDTKVAKIEQAKSVGKILAGKAISAGVKAVVFDRGGYLYHGRVKALADGAREGGLEL